MRSKIWNLIAALVLGACSSVAPITGSGNVRSEERTVSGVSAVNLATIGTLVIQQGSAETLVVETDDNILPLIATNVKDRTLTIDSSRNFSDPTTLTYTLTVIELNAITLSGAGAINADNLTADTLSLESSGAGSMALGDLIITSGADIVHSGAGNMILSSLESADTVLDVSGVGSVDIGVLVTTMLQADLRGAGNAALAGRVSNQTVTVSGVGSYNAENLVSASAIVSTSGAGSITVNASESLDATVTGGGSVLYVGNPVLTQDDSGAGEIRAK